MAPFGFPVYVFCIKQVVRLLYTNSGLALTSNAIHKLWKWQRNERNPSGKLWQPTKGLSCLMTWLMRSQLKTLLHVLPCLKTIRMSCLLQGGKVFLFNMMNFKVMTTFMPPPPAASYLAFHPQDNNIIAIGMEDSRIQIYNVRVDEMGPWVAGVVDVYREQGAFIFRNAR